MEDPAWNIMSAKMDKDYVYINSGGITWDQIMDCGRRNDFVHKVEARLNERHSSRQVSKEKKQDVIYEAFQSHLKAILKRLEEKKEENPGWFYDYDNTIKKVKDYSDKLLKVIQEEGLEALDDLEIEDLQ